jgi:hypothetical protein
LQQRLQDTNEINRDKLNNIRPENSRHSRIKRDYLKNKIHEIAMNSKNENIKDLYRGLNNF